MRTRPHRAGSGTSRRSLPRTDAEVFALLGDSWKEHTKGFDGTARIRTRCAAGGSAVDADGTHRVWFEYVLG